MTTDFKLLAIELDARFADLDAAGRLRAAREALDGKLVFTTSLGLEDQVLTSLVAAERLEIEIRTLDTGRLFPETYALWAETEQRYGQRIHAYYPERDEVEALVAGQGIDGFYTSVEARKACCHVRKVVPLGRALSGASGWITGLRADQSADRQGLGFVAFDAARGLLKINPLYDWTRAQAAEFARANEVPVSPLHKRGFLSIGCAPCTRAVAPGEAERAGRWWWEDEVKKECGLHVDESGRLVRARGAEQVA